MQDLRCCCCQPSDQCSAGLTYGPLLSFPSRGIYPLPKDCALLSTSASTTVRTTTPPVFQASFYVQTDVSGFGGSAVNRSAFGRVFEATLKEAAGTGTGLVARVTSITFRDGRYFITSIVVVESRLPEVEYCRAQDIHLDGTLSRAMRAAFPSDFTSRTSIAPGVFTGCDECVCTKKTASAEPSVSLTTIIGASVSAGVFVIVLIALAVVYTRWQSRWREETVGCVR